MNERKSHELAELVHIALRAMRRTLIVGTLVVLMFVLWSFC